MAQLVNRQAYNPLHKPQVPGHWTGHAATDEQVDTVNVYVGKA